MPKKLAPLKKKKGKKKSLTGEKLQEIPAPPGELADATTSPPAGNKLPKKKGRKYSFPGQDQFQHANAGGELPDIDAFYVPPKLGRRDNMGANMAGNMSPLARLSRAGSGPIRCVVLCARVALLSGSAVRVAVQ